MKILSAFQDYLFSQTQSSKLTVKNYVSDVKRFVKWYENEYACTFEPEAVTPQMLLLFRERLLTPQAGTESGSSPSIAPSAIRSVERYFSSLRKFFNFLALETMISTNPFDSLNETRKQQFTPDPWKIQAYKEYLYVNKASDLTIKNYIIDLYQFITWLTQSSSENDHYDIKKRDLFSSISPILLEEYKRRLLHEAKAAPTTVNRKLSSLRKYILWAQSQGIIKPFEAALMPKALPADTSIDASPRESDPALTLTESIVEALGTEDSLPDEIEQPLIPEKPFSYPVKKPYSSFPPLRLMQKLRDLGLVFFDTTVVLPVLAVSDTVLYGVWKAKGSPVFINPTDRSISSRINQLLLRTGILDQVTSRKPKLIASLPKSFYAPLALSMRHAPLHRKAWFHIKHSRPQWYHTYHSYSIVHYVHAAVLVVCMSAAGFGVVQAMSDTTPSSVSYASLPSGPPRLLSFKGKLTRSDSSPITANTNLRFGIYNDAVASGSAKLWEEVREVVPNPDGSFSLLLGERKSIDQHLFSDNARLYIGMTVENNNELTPRKQIPTEVLASTSESVQGLRPISDPRSNQKNALLVLDSSGNMVISGNANPTFVATGGKFTLSGQTLLLSTTPGSNADIQLIPDGEGKIDAQRPIHNTSNTINASGIAGAVSLDDTVVISASQSGQSALYINQNSMGPLISASHSGIAKFTVDSNGSATFGDSLMLYGNSLSTTQTSFNLLTTSPINLSIGTSSTALSIGATSGVTTINNSQTVVSGNLNVNGTTGLTFGNAAAGIQFSGQGAHLITASAGNLQLGAVTLTGNTGIGNNVSLVPTGTDGENNLGSASNPFDSLYVNSIISPSISNASFWQSLNGAIAPNHLTHSIMLGSTASESAVWQVFASGDHAGTASSSGNLSFRGNTTTINQLNGGSLTFQTSEGGNANLLPRMTISNSGNVGLGTTTPAYRLDIPNMADASGQGRANAWVTYSSSRYKENITVIDNPLEKIGRLQGVYYSWKQAYGGSRDIGFIAEEVGQVLPELVEYEEDGIHAKSLKYDRITALTIEGIKAQQDEITELQTMVNELTLTNNQQFHIIGRDGNTFAVESDSGQELERRGVVSSLIAGTIDAGKATMHRLTTGTIEASEAVLGFMRVSSVESDFIAVTDMTVSGKLRATNATILSLQTDALTSTESDTQFSLRLGRTGLVFYGLTGDQTTDVASIDNQGNASFAGLLNAKDAVIEQSVTTKKVIAEELDLTDEGLMSLALNLSRYLPSGGDQNNSEDIAIVTSTSDPSASGSGEEASTPLVNPSTGDIVSEYTSFPESQSPTGLASGSGSLTMTPPDSSVAMGTPMPSGAGYVVSDLSVAGMITISGNFILNDESIDVVGADLQLQPLRSGGVSFMAGLVTINPSGDLMVAGNANFARDVTVGGRLATNVLSPVEGKDLIVKLGQDNRPSNRAFVVQDATGAASLSIKESGDVTSEGKGTFSSLLSQSLTIMRGSQADASPVKTVASSSAGTAVILPGQTQRTIVTPFVFAKSLIYITPTSDTQGYVPYVARQTPEDVQQGSQGSFTIEITEPITKPIKINWWIVN